VLIIGLIWLSSNQKPVCCAVRSRYIMYCIGLDLRWPLRPLWNQLQLHGRDYIFSPCGMTAKQNHDSPVCKVSTMRRRSPAHNILLAQQILAQNRSKNGWRGAKKQNFVASMATSSSPMSSSSDTGTSLSPSVLPCHRPPLTNDPNQSQL